MAIDLRRSLLAAAEAALEDALGDRKTSAPKKPRLRGGRALLLGAGLMTAGRIAVAARGHGALDSIRERLADYEARHLGRGGEGPDDEYDDEFDDEEFEEEDEEFDEDDPEAEGDEDLDQDEPAEAASRSRS